MICIYVFSNKITRLKGNFRPNQSQLYFQISYLFYHIIFYNYLIILCISCRIEVSERGSSCTATVSVAASMDQCCGNGFSCCFHGILAVRWSLLLFPWILGCSNCFQCCFHGFNTASMVLNFDVASTDPTRINDFRCCLLYVYLQ